MVRASVVQAIDGSSRQFVGGLEGYARLSPVFFPDGRRIAYWKGGRDDCAIVEHDLESGAQKVLVDCAQAPRSRFDLSPDGLRLAVSVTPRAQFPAGIAIVERPLNVSARPDAGTIAAPLSRNAICAALMVSGLVPNALLRTTRTRRPPMLVCTICLSVWLLKCMKVVGAGGAAGH